MITEPRTLKRVILKLLAEKDAHKPVDFLMRVEFEMKQMCDLSDWYAEHC